MDSVSFNADHRQMERGIYLSRVDQLDGSQVYTLDLRLRIPYQEAPLSERQLHTFEHCFATAIREELAANPYIEALYFGPMGCATGFYFLFGVNYANAAYPFNAVTYALQAAINRLRQMTEVPAKNERQCGNYFTLGDISEAQELGGQLERLLVAAMDRDDFDSYVLLEDQS